MCMSRHDQGLLLCLLLHSRLKAADLQTTGARCAQQMYMPDRCLPVHPGAQHAAC